MKYIAIVSLALLLASCSEQNGQGNSNGTDTTSTLSAANSSAPEAMNEELKEMFGTFVGDLPCPDCENIRMAVSLNGNMTAVVKQKYIGAEIKAQVPGVLNGTWKSNADKTEIVVNTEKGEMVFRVVNTSNLVPMSILGQVYTCEKDCMLSKFDPVANPSAAPAGK